MELLLPESVASVHVGKVCFLAAAAAKAYPCDDSTKVNEGRHFIRQKRQMWLLLQLKHVSACMC